MSTIGGNLEKKEIGLHIGVSGTHDSTEINKTTGFLQLMEVDTDGLGRPIFAEKGSWTSDVIDLGDKFHDFEKVFTTNTITSASSFAVLTRVSDNNRDWSDWVAIAEDGAIQSDTKQYIQVRIDLFAGFVTDNFIISKSDFEKNEYVEVFTLTDGKYLVPKLTSNTSSPIGVAFADSVYGSNLAWNAFDGNNTTYWNSSTAGSKQGVFGFVFSSEQLVSSYKLINTIGVKDSMVKDWVLQGSNNTKTGLDGDWVEIHQQTNIIWNNTTSQEKIFSLSKPMKYKAFRIKWTANSGNVSNTAIAEMNFYTPESQSMQLQHNYQYDMALDKTWSDTGSLHRKKITREKWVKIDKLNISER